MIAPSLAESYRTYYDALSRAIGELEEKVARLEADNAKLRRKLGMIFLVCQTEEEVAPVTPAPTPAPAPAAPAPVADLPVTDENFLLDQPHTNGLVAVPDEQAVA